ncbi:protein DBF4 homolog A [Centroberyx affinis]|uniref:protein DBF4 homolog A n=1 Tax=Centroberyx affinis TaxID=166261 RepID=UPI003A5C403B
MKENKMKPRRIQRHIKPSLQEKVVDIGDKSTLSQAKSCVPYRSYPTQVKPFAGRVFYLDLPANRKTETLENDIKELGGTVEKFFSKEIKYLVSNKKEARYAQCFRRDSPVPSPDSGHSSPHPHPNPHRPASHRDNLKARSQGQTDTFVTSRGKSLVARVVKEQERIQMNKILSNALEWGVKILYIDDVMAYVEKKKTNVTNQCTVTAAVKKSAKAECTGRQGFQKCKGGRISKPFVKVEDSSRHYRPIYVAMPNMPEFNLKTVPPCTPFCVEDKDHPGKRQRGQRGPSEERGQGRARKNRDKKRGGYCECCMLKYDNLTVHLKSECHKAFSRSDEYLVVDRLVSTLHCNFIHIKTKVNRPKCSISSILIAPGPYGKTEQRHIDTTETKEEQQTPWTVPGCGELSLGHLLKKHSSVPVSAPVIRGEGDRRSCDNTSDKSQHKHKSLSRKRPCRQDSLSIRTHRAELAQIPRPKAETAPSRGESFTSNPAILSKVPQAHPECHRTHTDKNGSTSHNNKEDLQNEFPSNSLNVTSSRHEVSPNIQDSSLKESTQDGHVLPEQLTGVSESEGGNIPTQSHSPVRAIRRRVRVYKRKRRKVDTQLTCQEHAKPGDIPDNSMLKLWQLFQSSEDMDLEFRGFED